MTSYPEIEIADIRKGDKIRVDLTCNSAYRQDYVEYTAKGDRDGWDRAGAHYLMSRPVEFVNGMIVKASDNEDYWVRTGKDQWAGFYFSIQRFIKDSITNDAAIAEWIRKGQAHVV